jgi:hypothetical protein
MSGKHGLSKQLRGWRESEQLQDVCLHWIQAGKAALNHPSTSILDPYQTIVGKGLEETRNCWVQRVSPLGHQTADRLLALGQRPGHLTFAQPGMPSLLWSARSAKALCAFQAALHISGDEQRGPCFSDNTSYSNYGFALPSPRSSMVFCIIFRASGARLYIGGLLDRNPILNCGGYFISSFIYQPAVPITGIAMGR